MTAAHDAVGRAVRAFYEAMPFNEHASTRDAADGLRVPAIETAYPDLHGLLASGKVASVLEFGCGVGWLANGVAHHYGIAVTGVDFTANAVARARDVARTLGTDGLARFELADLFAYAAGDGTADLVASVGVLHHTHDARAAFERIARFVAPRGHVYLGLYHGPGRRPFLDLFHDLLLREGEDAAFRRYRDLDAARRGDDAHLRSWFRDQVLHPHETQHTLREVAGWLAAAGFSVRSTSINGFEPFERVEDVYAMEPRWEDVSRRAIGVEGRYFPGFFTVLAQRMQ